MILWNGNIEMEYHKENGNNTHTMHKYQLNECSFCFRKVEKVRTRWLRYALIRYRCSFLMAIQWYWFYSKTEHDIGVFISSVFFSVRTDWGSMISSVSHFLRQHNMHMQQNYHYWWWSESRNFIAADVKRSTMDSVLKYGYALFKVIWINKNWCANNR